MVATLLLLAGLYGCGGESPAVLPPTAQAPTQGTPQTTALPTPTITEELRSDRDRDNSPSATRADLKGLVQGNNDFAFDLYRALRDGESNLFYSPFSISQALAMTFAGAGGETERQMADTLQFRLPQSSLHPPLDGLKFLVCHPGREHHQHLPEGSLWATFIGLQVAGPLRLRRRASSPRPLSGAAWA